MGSMSSTLHSSGSLGFQFDARTGTWNGRRDDGKAAKPDSDALVLMTYNVWFEPHRWEERMPALFALFQEHDPDVLCIQEATRSFLADLYATPWAQGMVVSDPGDASTMERYGVVTLVKPHLMPRFIIRDFTTTRMGRKLLVSTIVLPKSGKHVSIGNVHLESMNSGRLRVTQMGESFEVLGKASHAVLCGDFNFSDDFPETKKLEAYGYTDTWLATNPAIGAKGYTMPTDVSWPAWRPDHIMLRSKDDADLTLVAESVTIIGDRVLPGPACDRCRRMERICTPSDHFGLVTRIVPAARGSAAASGPAGGSGTGSGAGAGGL